MDKKSFIRGFGTGVLFATIILGISCLIRTSDSSVIKRAKELGMDYIVEEESLFQKKEAATKGAVSSSKEKKEDKKAKETQAPTKSPEKKESQEKQKDVKDPGEEFEEAKKEIEKDMEEISRELTIREGEWSSDVSRNLEEMDIISSAEDFDAYLEEYGYSNKIKAGTFEIPSGADYEEIAKMITS